MSIFAECIVCRMEMYENRKGRTAEYCRRDKWETEQDGDKRKRDRKR